MLVLYNVFIKIDLVEKGQLWKKKKKTIYGLSVDYNFTTSNQGMNEVSLNASHGWTVRICFVFCLRFFFFLSFFFFFFFWEQAFLKKKKESSVAFWK
jgi:hypothetical protein